MREMLREITVLDRKIRIHFCDTGNGINILIEGGDKSHIGSVAVAEPHSETEIVTFPGHREDVICRQWAETLASIYPGPVVIEAGVHYDHAGKNEICGIVEALERELDTVEEIIKDITLSEN